MRDIGLFMDQYESGQTSGVDAKFKDLLLKADHLLPSINAYKTRLILSYVNLPDLTADNRIKLFVSTEPCKYPLSNNTMYTYIIYLGLRYCFPQYHPGLGFYLRDVAYFCATAQLFEDAIDYVNESLEIMERIFIEHEVIEGLRVKLAEYQKKAALVSLIYLLSFL